MSDISNRDDIINLEDVDERIAELESERDACREAIDEALTAFADAHGKGYADMLPDELMEKDGQDDFETPILDAQAALTVWEDDNAAELKALTEFRDEASGLDGPMIRESYFKEYAMELAEDIGAIPRDAAWPATCIDWEQAASELQMDYTGADFDGVTYYGR